MTDLATTAPAVTPTTDEGGVGRGVLPFLCLAQFMVFLDISIVNVALPSIQRSLGLAATDLPYVVTAYGTVLGGFLLLGSRLGDTFGRRRALQAGLALFGLASLAAGLADAAPVLFAARGAQGLGAALVAPSALSILTTTYAEGPARAKALGVWGALSGIASVAGVVLGGLITGGPGWRWIFFVNVPIAVATVAFAPRVLPESRGRRLPFDLVGAVLLTGGLLSLVHALGEATTRGWVDPRSGGFLVGGALLLVAFLVTQRRHPAPLVPVAVFRLRELRAANVIAVLVMGAVVTMFFFVSLFMQQVLGWSAWRTGLAYVPLALTVAISAGVSSALVLRLSPRFLLAGGLGLSALGLVLLARLSPEATYLSHVLPPFLVVALGLGACFVVVQVAASAGVDEERAGLAAGLIGTTQEIGGALGLAVAATVAFGGTGLGGDHAGGDLVGQFHTAFLVAAALVVLAVGPAVRGIPRRPADSPSA